MSDRDEFYRRFSQSYDKLHQSEKQDDLVERVAREIHDGLGGDGWGYCCYGGNEEFHKADELRSAARAAIAFRRPTKIWEEHITEGRLRYLNLPGTLPIEGGLPIVIDNQFVGAIGVSGVRSFEDAQIAQAGIDALGS